MKALFIWSLTLSAGLAQAQWMDDEPITLAEKIAGQNVARRWSQNPLMSTFVKTAERYYEMECKPQGTGDALALDEKKERLRFTVRIECKRKLKAKIVTVVLRGQMTSEGGGGVKELFPTDFRVMGISPARTLPIGTIPTP